MTQIVSTSQDLLKIFPRLADNNGWEKFASEFDKEECIKYRNKVKSAFRPKRSQHVIELAGYCRTILRSELLAQFKLQEDGTRKLITQEEVLRDRMDAAVQLAKKVEVLFSPSIEGNKLRNALRAEADANQIPINRQDKGSAAAIVLFAFLKFIDREKRLPTKKELNIEANRLTKCVTQKGGKKEFGEKIDEDWIVYDSYISDFKFLETESMNKAWSFRCVPSSEWDELCYEKSSGLAEHTTPLGLKGLAEANKDKGKRDRF